MWVKKEYFFTNKLSLHQANELHKKVWYLSDELIDFSFIYDQDLCLGIRYTIPDDQDKDFIEYLTYIIENDILNLKDIEFENLWENNCNLLYKYDDIIEYLYNSDIMDMIGEGQLVLKSPLLELFDFFDALFKELSCRIFQSNQYKFPTLLGTDTLRKAGYFDSFPNLWMSIFRMKNEFETFKKRKELIDSSRYNINDHIKVLKYSLPPTMCYYVYNMLSNKIINNQSITTVGKSFRFENKYCSEMGRLWDFTIRETVFLGDAQYVEGNVDNYRKRLCNLMEKLGLCGTCTYASDPFFLSDNNALRINVQRMKHVKSELRLNLNKDKQLAVASFNKHGSFLGKRFNILLENTKQYVVTGCIGIGIERFLIAFLCHYGYNIKDWPSLIRDNFEDCANSKKVFDILMQNDEDI